MVKLGSTLESSRKDGRLANSDNIYDKISGKMQEEINQEVSALSPVDEEDLTRSLGDDGRSVTKFADRSYSPQNFSGKGYKILRKNIKPVSLAVTEIVVSSVPTSDGYLSFIINGVESHVDVVASTDTTTDKVAEKIATKLNDTMSEYDVSRSASTINLTHKFGGTVSTASSFSAVGTGASCSIKDSTKKELRNLLTAVMMNQPNTIYEIRYDFDLDGNEITIPEGCILKFEGGNIYNGILIGNKTLINKKNVLAVLRGTFVDSYTLKEINNIFRKTSKCKFEIKQNFTGNDDQIKTMLEYNIKCFGLNKGVFAIPLMFDANKKFQIGSTDLSLNQLASNLLNAKKKADIHELKFYINKTDYTFTGTSDHEVIMNYVTKLVEIVKYLNNVADFDTVYISNEWRDFSVKFTDENRETFVLLVKSLKNMGKKVGCTYQGFANMVKAEDSIYDILDCPAFNFYPRVFFGANDEVNENMDFSATIKELFDSYIQQLHILGKKKRIIVSEIGITYQNRGLAHPASVYDGIPTKPEFSLQMYIYYKSLIKALSQINEDIEINLWYCADIKLSRFDKLLKEFYYE